MNIRFLETLVWLTRLQSFGRTAEMLNATQPAISNRINKLEELLGAPLYNRSRKQFELTAEGRRILPLAEEIVRISEEIRLSIDPSQNGKRELSIGSIEIITMSWLPSLLRRAIESLPLVTFRVGAGRTQQLIHQLREGDFDVVFVVGPIDEPGVVSHHICRVQHHWMANPTKFDCGNEIDIVELSRLPLIMPDLGSSSYNIIVGYFHSYGILEIPSRERRLVVDSVYSIYSIVELVRSGLGVMALPSFFLHHDLLEGRIASLNVRQKLPPIDIVACYRKDSFGDVSARVIEEAIAAARDAAAIYGPGEVNVDD